MLQWIVLLSNTSNVGQFRYLYVHITGKSRPSHKKIET